MLTKRCTHPDQKKCKCVYWYVFELHGRRYRKSTRTADRKVAERVEIRRRAAIIDNKDDDATPKITLKKHIKDYTAYTAKKNRTAYKDASTLARLITAVGDRTLSDVSPFHIEKWKRDRAGTVCRATVNRELNIVRGCFSRAVEWHRIGTSPLGTVKPYKVDDVRVRVLNDGELRTILQDADADVCLICRTTLECLPRLSEVLSLRREHIGSSWIETRRKGGSVERVAVTDELREQLLARCHTSGYVFGEGKDGDPLYEQLASLRIVRELQRLGVTDASHHTMRHTGVTLMLEAGVNPRVIQRLAGWSSLRMLERYGHARDAEIRRAVSSNAAHLNALTRFWP